LDTLLNKALTSDDAYANYSGVCVALTSMPLPKDMGKPAVVGHFFIRVVDDAVNSPSIETLKPVYRMASGFGVALLEMLPSGKALEFEERMLRLLSANDHLVNVLCLAISAVLVSSKNRSDALVSLQSGMQSPLPQHCTSVQSNSYDCHRLKKLFNEKAKKTIQLIVLRVTFACSRNKIMTPEQSIDGVEQAVLVIENIDEHYKSCWTEENSDHVKKLHQKVLQTQDNPELQLIAFRFITSLQQPNTIPSELVGAFEKLIGRSSRVGNGDDEALILRTPAEAMKCLASKFDETFATDIVHSALDLANCKDGPSKACHNAFSSSKLVIDSLRCSVLETQSLRHEILSALQTNEFAKPLRSFTTLDFHQFLEGSHSQAFDGCPTLFQDTRRQLCAAICSLLLETMLYSHSDDFGIDTTLAMALLKCQESFAIPLHACSYIAQNKRATNTLSLFEESSTPNYNLDSRDWRTKLAMSLKQSVSSQHESIIREVGMVCRDLEDRCETVEKPLREEKERLTMSIAAFEEASVKIATLETEASERELFAAGLESERNRIEGRINEMITEAESQARELESRTKAFQESKEQLERDVATAKEEAINKRLEYDLAQNMKDEAYDELENDMDRMEQELNGLREDLENANQERNERDLTVARLQKELDESSMDVEMERTSNARKDGKIDELLEELDTLTSRIDELTKEVKSPRYRLYDLTDSIHSSETPKALQSNFIEA
jgi:outer membrane murein-binding lipoprotein Lpp